MVNPEYYTRHCVKNEKVWETRKTRRKGKGEEQEKGRREKSMQRRKKAEPKIF